MSTFSHELKLHRRGLIFWSVGMVLLVASGMQKYASYSGSGQAITELMAQFPPMVQTLFGLNGFDLSTAIGFYGVLFLYIAIMAGIHAAIMGSQVLTEEEQNKTVEFLYVKPVSRHRVVSAKLAAGLVNIIILNFVATATSFLMLARFVSLSAVYREVSLLMVGLFIIQLLFFFLGAFLAAALPSYKTPARLATGALLVSYLIYVAIGLSDRLSFLRFVSPLQYFDAKDIINTGKLDPVYLVISGALIVLMFGLTYRMYQRKDLGV